MTHQPQTARRRPPPSSGTSHCWKHKQLLGSENCLIAREALFSRPLTFRQKGASGVGADHPAHLSAHQDRGRQGGGDKLLSQFSQLLREISLFLTTCYPHLNLKMAELEPKTCLPTATYSGGPYIKGSRNQSHCCHQNCCEILPII